MERGKASPTTPCPVACSEFQFSINQAFYLILSNCQHNPKLLTSLSFMASIFLPNFFIAAIFLFIRTQSQFDELFHGGFSDGNSDIALDMAAQIHKNGVLTLTNNSGRLSYGHAFHKFPFQFKNSTSGRAFSFSSTFAFIINPEYPVSGHGLAFVVAPSRSFQGLPREYLGLPNVSDNGNFSKHLFAVEFDTFQDSQFKDINDNHVGVDIGSFVSRAAAAAAYFTDDGNGKQELFLKSGKVIKAWIDYDSTQNSFNVTVSPYNSKPRKPILSYNVDLSPILNDYMYVGFSASTGLYSSSHFILGWSFKMNGQARDLDLSSLPAPFKKSSAKLIIRVCVLAAILTVSVISVAVYIIKVIKNVDRIETWEFLLGPHRYSYKELHRATRGFRDKELLGHGGFGKVYRGTLPSSKTQVAVKRISNESQQGLREFVSEIATIGLLRHRNLVQLLGWCRRRRDLLLVYDYMANGSLDKCLFDNPKTILNWEQRFRIIKGVASALLYLHEGYEQVVIHRDVKASNVLLDSDLNGRLGDFGLAKVYEHGSIPNTTRVVGTLGYMAPELARTGKATTSSDVYAFGGLMLEVACGRRPVELKALPEEMILVDWVWEKYREGKLLEVVDPKLDGEYDETEMAMVLKLGVMCSNVEVKQRPSMRQVVRCLDGEIGVAEDWRATGKIDDGKIQGEGLTNYLLASVSNHNSFSSTINGDRE